MMGCAQSSANVTPPPSINHIPIERLYGNEDYSLAQTSPVVMITATTTPAHIKSALKKLLLLMEKKNFLYSIENYHPFRNQSILMNKY